MIAGSPGSCPEAERRPAGLDIAGLPKNLLERDWYISQLFPRIFISLSGVSSFNPPQALWPNIFRNPGTLPSPFLARNACSNISTAA